MRIQDTLEKDFLLYQLAANGLPDYDFWLGAIQSKPPSDGKWYWTKNYGEKERSWNDSQWEIKDEANWYTGEQFKVLW